MNRTGFIVFLSIILSIWTIMHVYVLWRLWFVPVIVSHCSRRMLILLFAILWTLYPLARMLHAQDLHAIAAPVEWIGTTWIGTLFLLLSALLATDVATAGGYLMPSVAPRLRGWATAFASLLAVVALAQGLRAPVVRDYEVNLPGLPAERDGLILVALSDLHLGTLIGQRWLTQLIHRVESMRPDLVVLVGDVIDGNIKSVEPLLPVLQKFKAPLGAWAVTGNHEFYAGLEPSVALFQRAGFQVLRDRSAQVVPGLVIAGVDDLTARAQFGMADHAVETALSNRPSGATILLSHSPWKTEDASRLGAALMLSGHTHNGQIWPFTYLVKARYPLLAERYQVGNTTLIVGRGTGTWGPRMRLWHPSEILRIRLRSVP